MSTAQLRDSQSVLLFPPVNNFRRYLIHQTCDNFKNKYDLFTFSVGQGPYRRTVICFKNQLLDPEKYLDSVTTSNFETRQKNANTSLLKSWRSDSRRLESLDYCSSFNTCDKKMGVDRNITDTNKINKQNVGNLYRPPAIRTNANDAIKKKLTVNEEVNKESSSGKLTTELTSPSLSYPTLSKTTSTLISCISSPIHENENTIKNNSMTSTHKTAYKTHQQDVDEQQKQLRQQQQVRRERRPDRAVYIPRARRSQTTPPNTTSQIQSQPQQQALSTQLPAIAPILSSNTNENLSQQLAITSDNTINVLVKQKPSAKADEVSKINIIKKNTHENIHTTITKKKEKLSKENNDLREQRGEQQILKKISTQQTRNNSENFEKANEDYLYTIVNNDEILENHSKNQEVILSDPKIHALEVNGVNHLSECNDKINLSKDFNCDNCKQLKTNQELLGANVQSLSFLNLIKEESHESTKFVNPTLNDLEMSQAIMSAKLCPKSTTNSINVSTSNIFITSSNNNKMSNTSNKNNITTNLRIEDIESQQSPAKCDIEEQELQRASKEINRSNRRIIKQTFLSDVLQIPDSIDEKKSKGESKISIVSKPSTNVATLKTQFDSNTEEEDDDWESMYNESGDCLDPKIMQELTASVGKCKIELPKMDYSSFLTKQSILNEEEFPHVLEVSNFPVEFKNQDLLMVFSQYKESGFDIKWVDDTHALAVFSNSRIAAEVLTMGHPFVVLKPLAEATIESRLKAKKCAASLQPYRPRPKTCAALARRLVTGALGVRLKTAAAERENEKRVLREAKERKLLAAKQRDEVWES